MNILWEVFTLFFTVITLLLGYVCYIRYQMEGRLKWAKSVPGFPIIGNALEFESTITYLPALDSILKRMNSDTVVLSVLNKFNLLSKEYKFLEFIMSSTKVLNKSEAYRFFHNWLGTGLLTADGPKWKPRRKVITPAFHFGILEQFVEVFDSNGKILIEKLEKEVDKDSINIYSHITLCALDIICETAMGVSVNAQRFTDSEYVKSVKNLCKLVMDRAFSLIKMYDLPYKFTNDYHVEQKCLSVVHDYTDSVIQKRMEERKNKKSDTDNSLKEDVGAKRKIAFLDLLLEAKIDGKPLSKEDIREEVDTFMFEGHDTTASAMSFALYCLANNPEEQRKAFEEQMDIFGDDLNRSTTHHDLMNMRYLELVIKETLRLYPSVPIIERHFNEDIEYDGNIIPKDSSVSVYIYGLNHDEKIYPEPEKFIPTRYEEPEGAHRRPYAFLAFSAGPRNCIGQKFAMLEMKCTLAKILRNFELLPAIPEHKLVLAAETVLKSANGINIRLKKRTV